jgi:SAM-dependent methyltransferase
LTGQRPHSAEWFTELREYWWNPDYLELTATRLGLERARTVLDVGCGVGHWSFALGMVLSDEAELTGVDREPQWVAQATERAARFGLERRFRFCQGDAAALAFAEGSFDLVTCQTVLIHVPDPLAVIREMLRVAKPGGQLLLVEPNNLASFAISTSANVDAPIDELVDLYRFALMCERGKAKLGEGHSSVGDLLPGHLIEAGAVAVETFISDKASALHPPYAAAEQQALREAALAQARRSEWILDRNDCERWFTAAGGTPSEFAATWARRLDEGRHAAAALSEGSFHSAGGVIQYVVAARRRGL